MRTQDDRDIIRRKLDVFRDAMTKLASLAADRNVPIVFRGARCFTDGRVINLPSLDLLQDTEASDLEVETWIQATVGYVFHEVGHILFTDWPTLQRANKRLGAQGAVLLNTFEDAFVERKMLELWRGSDRSIINALNYVVEEQKDKYREAPVFGQIQQLLWFLARGRAWSHVIKLFDPRVAKWVDEHLSDVIEEAGETDSTAGNARLAKIALAKIKAAFEEEEKTSPPPPPQSSDDSEDGDSQKPQSGGDEDEGDEDDAGDDPGPSDGDEPEDDDGEGGEDDGDEDGGEEPVTSSDDSEEDDEDSGDDGDEQGGGEDDESEEDDGDSDGGHGDEEDSTGEDGESGLPDDGSLNAPPDENATSMSSVLQKKFDYLRGGDSDFMSAPYTIYSTEGDTYIDIEKRIEPASPFAMSNFHAAERRVADIVGPTRAALARVLRARSLAYKVGDQESGRLDTRNLYKIAVASERGTVPRAYTQEVKGQTFDLAVLIVVNESGSMTHAPGREELAAASALVLGDVLDNLGIQFGMFGHTTSFLEVGQKRYQDEYSTRASMGDEGAHEFTRWGDTRIEWVKRFGQPWRVRRENIGYLTAWANTHDAEVVRYATRQLQAVPRVGRRIIIMLDDGVPMCNMQDSRYMRRHGQELILAVKEATRAAVETVGVGMLDSSVSQFYPDFVVVYEIEQLPNVLLSKFGELLGYRRRA